MSTGAVAAAGLSSAPATAAAVPLDALDMALVRLLSRDARMSQRQLAREVGSTAPTVGERLARLERAGVIRAYRAELDWAALGVPMLVYLSVVAVQGSDQSEVVAALRALPEVEDVHVVTGPMDLIVRLRLRNHEHLRETLFDRVWKVPGVQRTETLLSLASMPPKDYAADLIDTLVAPPLPPPRRPVAAAASRPPARRAAGRRLRTEG